MRRRANNPFPGVTRVQDRHGKPRWRFRLKGHSGCYIHGEYAGAQFRAEYENALRGSSASSTPARAEYGTFNWLIEQYLCTTTWQKLAPITKRNLRGDMDRFRASYGGLSVKTLRPNHVEKIIGKKAETPSAANKLLKLLRRLCRFAVRKELIAVDPTIGIERFAENPDGFHTWTDEEIQSFEDHHGPDSKAVLALRLILCTGASRQDVAALGRQNVKDSRILYRRGKTGGDVDLPILDELAEVLAQVPAGQMIFLTHGKGRPYKATTFGNWFRDQCVAAGLPHCSSHGLRKAGATRLANFGANELEIMAFLGHRTPNEARTYIKKANRRQLADRGMERWQRVKREQGVSNPVERLDIKKRKSLNNKGN